MSKKKRFVIKWPIILGVQFLASVLLMVFVLKLGALPTTYLIAVGAVLGVLLLINYFLMRPSKKHESSKTREAIGKMISLLLSVVLIVGSIYISQGNDLLGNITGATEKTNRFNVYVLDDSEVESLDDLSFKFVGMSKEFDDENHYLEAHNALLNQNSKIRIKEYDDYASLALDFYNGEIEAMYVNEAYDGMFETDYPKFTSEVKSVWSHDIVEQIIDISKNVQVSKDTFTIYISGIDTTGPISTVSRSDVNMLVTINPITKDILMTSIPRDYYVPLADKGKPDKLTHSALTGIENTVKTIENFMGIDINYYARVNFTSLIKIVDALGGIDVYSPKAFINSALDLQVKKGMNHFTGIQALRFVRERYALGGSDTSRLGNQQRVLKAMLNKAMSPSIIKNYTKLLNAVDGSFETNMLSEEILELIQMQLSDMTAWSFHSTVLEGDGQTMTGGAYMPNQRLYYSVPIQESVDETADLIKQMVKGEKITLEDVD